MKELSRKLKKVILVFGFVSMAVMLFPAILKADDFNVADFGAIGDGLTDDGPAVRLAVAAAIKAGPGSTVVFEPKKYRLARHTAAARQISLNGISDLTIDGRGAEIINNPYNGFISINHCTNVTMRGFYFDCDPLGFSQGDVIKVGPDKGEMLVKIHEGFTNPVELSEAMGKKMWNEVSFAIDPVERKLKKASPDHCRIESITSQSGAKGVVRVKLKSGPLAMMREGDRFIFSLNYGGGGATIEVNFSSDIHLENYTIYSAKYGMNHSFRDNVGRVYVKGVNITFRPGTDRLVTSVKDGFHVKHNAVGPIIEDCLLEGMMDDSINISVCPYWVKEDLGNNKYLVIGKASKGDTLMVFTPNPGTVTHDVKILDLEPQPTPRGFGSSNRFSIITLNKAIPDLGLFQGTNTFPGGPEKLKFTGLYNIDASGKNYIIRNNTFLAQRRHAVLARATGGLIEGNIIDGIGGCGINLGNEIGSFYEGPFPGKTTIRNNTFRNTVRTPINVYTRGKNAWAKDITITNNTFTNSPDVAIALRNVDGGIITNNTFETNGKPVIDASKLITSSNCIDTVIETNH